MNVIMVNVFGKVPNKEYSHNAGWSFVVDDLIGCDVDYYDGTQDLSDYSHMIINNGVNYREGQLNFFGGVQQFTIDLLNDIRNNFNGKCYTFDHNFSFEDLLKRKEIDNVPDLQVNTVYSDTKRSNLIVGDSHSISAFPFGERYSISRNDGKTLHGFLKDPMAYIFKNSEKRKLENLIMYFGNIDIRFHLSRRENPTESTIDLANKYFDFAISCLGFCDNVKIQGLMPIEDESRKIPKTGQYKGENFFGDWQFRTYLVEVFNSTLKKRQDQLLRSGVESPIFMPHWIDTKKLSFDHMEARQSVHIRPSSYKYR